MDPDIEYALGKFSEKYAAATDEQRGELIRLLHNDFGLSIKAIGILTGLTNGAARYAYWKLVKTA